MTGGQTRICSSVFSLSSIRDIDSVITPITLKIG